MVNPNTGTAPIFRSRRDSDLTKAIYARVPVLVNRSGDAPVATWPVKYTSMFHMTNDSGHFKSAADLKKLGAYPVAGGRWKKGKDEFVPLYEGKMVQAYDHRAASVTVNPENLNRPAQPLAATHEQHRDTSWLPTPQFWVAESVSLWPCHQSWLIGFKDVTAPTNVRTMIAAAIPASGVGNTLPVIMPENDDTTWYHSNGPLALANVNSVMFDFVARQKVQGQHLNWFIVEQLPVIPAAAYDRRFGKKTARAIVREQVLALTYTAHDMAPFAIDMGHVDKAGNVRAPFPWDEEDRAHRRAKLDALYFHLYGVTDPDDVAHIFSTFPIVEREDIERWGRFLSRDLTLAYINALAAGDPDAKVKL